MLDKKLGGGGGGGGGISALPLTSLNHISLLCKSVEASLGFYQHVLGFFPIRRPGSFDFDGAWLFNYGIGIHLLQSEDPESTPMKKEMINPKDNHISFQCESMGLVEKKLTEMGVEYIKRCVEEGGIYVDQIFFHDPDGFMIEICNCDNLPVIPLAVVGDHHLRQISSSLANNMGGGVCKRVLISSLGKQQQQQEEVQQQQKQVMQYPAPAIKLIKAAVMDEQHIGHCA